MAVPDLITLSYFEALLTADIQEQRSIQLARNYHKGQQTVYMTDRARQFLDLNSEVDFRLNICQVIVTAVQDELSVIGFDTSETADTDGKKSQSQWANVLWQLNRMDAKQNDVHEAALRDREAFMIVDWDAEEKRPRLTFHERYISTEAGGDGTGCFMMYENDDINQPAIAGVKQWTETIEENGSTVMRMRQTRYYPDRIERYYFDNDSWQRYIEDDKPWPTPWTTGKGKNAKPLGIPVIHFKNEGLAPEAWEAIPLQDATNKIMLDILAACDFTGFRIYVALGFLPTTDGKELAADGSNAMTISPGQIVGSTKTKDLADFRQIDGADPTPMMNMLTSTIAIAAQITHTPVSRFVMTKQVAGSETVKEQDKPLQRKAKKRRVLFGNAWEDVMNMARRLSNHFGRAGLDEAVQFSTLWEHSTSMDELKEKRDVLQVPLEQIWIEAGYSPDQVAAMKKTPEYRLYMEDLLWKAVKAAEDAGIPLETVLRRAGIDSAEFGLIGTERLAAIKTKQEDTIPPTGQ